jgi:hypothetical protein
VRSSTAFISLQIKIDFRAVRHGSPRIRVTDSRRYLSNLGFLIASGHVGRVPTTGPVPSTVHSLAIVAERSLVVHGRAFFTAPDHQCVALEFVDGIKRHAVGEAVDPCSDLLARFAIKLVQVSDHLNAFDNTATMNEVKTLLEGEPAFGPFVADSPGCIARDLPSADQTIQALEVGVWFRCLP